MSTALITGSGTGIGNAIFKELALGTTKYDTVVGVRLRQTRTKETLEEQFQMDDEDPVAVAELQWDVSKKVPEEVADYLSDVGCVVHCAVDNYLDAYGKLDMDAVRRSLDTNILGTINLLNEMAKHRRENCRIIIISSVASTQPMTHSAAYNASKASQDMLVKQAAREFRDRFSVVGVRPGYIPNTVMSNYVKKRTEELRGMKPEDFDAYNIKNSVIGRFITMDEVIGTLRWLCHQAPVQAMTGQIITVSPGV